MIVRTAVRIGVKECGEEGKSRMREQVIDPVYAAMTRRRLRQCAVCQLILFPVWKNGLQESASGPRETIQSTCASTAIDLTYMLQSFSFSHCRGRNLTAHLNEAVSTHTPRMLASHRPPSMSSSPTSSHRTECPGERYPMSLAISIYQLEVITVHHPAYFLG